MKSVISVSKTCTHLKALQAKTDVSKKNHNKDLWVLRVFFFLSLLLLNRYVSVRSLVQKSYSFTTVVLEIILMDSLHSHILNICREFIKMISEHCTAYITSLVTVEMGED